MPKKTRITIRIDKNNPDLIKQLEDQAALINISVNKLILFILSNYLKK